MSESPVNLSWPAIMKTVNEDPYQFFIDGGWSFLAGNGDVSGLVECAPIKANSAIGFRRVRIVRGFRVRG